LSKNGHGVPWLILMMDFLPITTTWWWQIGFRMMAHSQCFGCRRVVVPSGNGGNHELCNTGLHKEEALG